MQDNELKNILEKLDVPPPSDGAKERAVNMAMQAFAEAQQKKTQGNASNTRLTHTAQSVWETIFGRYSMKKAYVLVGSFASLAIVLGITTTYYSDFQKHSPLVGDHYNPQTPMTTEPAPLAAAAPAKLIEPEATTASVSRAESKDDSLSYMAKSKEAEGKVVGQVTALPSPVAPASESLVMKAEEQVRSREAVANYAVSGLRDNKKQVADKMMMAAPADIYMQPQYAGADKFEAFKANPVKVVAQEPVSTFSIDADTASYSFVRRALNGGSLPPADAVRVEEMINYFSYNYPLPESKEQPFKPTVTVYPTPWNKETKLLHIGIKGYDIAKAEKPRSNLVFLIDVSGSMTSQDKLPLVKNALRMLVEQLNPNDTIAIVTYAGNAGTALEPTKVSDKERILSALTNLEAGGSTAGGQGIEQAYALAQANYDKKAVNRVILATDGDFNVGVTDPEQLQTLIERKRESGIFLSILGFGQGNYNDALMQKLAQHGNGTASYIDTLNEARKVLVEEAGSTLFTIAKDVKIQVEFNPAQVAEYRLVGYESRLLNREDFNNDKIDAGEVGAGHAVTAIYEITPVGAKPQSDPLRYGKEQAKRPPGMYMDDPLRAEFAFLKIRYKLPDENQSKLFTMPIDASHDISVLLQKHPKEDIKKSADDVRFAIDVVALGEKQRAPIEEVRFATAVAAYGLKLKGDTHVSSMSYDDIIALAEAARGKDEFGYRAEFINLIRLAKSLQGGQVQTTPQD